LHVSKLLATFPLSQLSLALFSLLSLAATYFLSHLISA
jgi:hypothetical protein